MFDLRRNIIENRKNGPEIACNNSQTLTTRSCLKEFSWPIKSLTLSFSTTNTKFKIFKQDYRRSPNFSIFAPKTSQKFQRIFGINEQMSQKRLGLNWERRGFVKTPMDTGNSEIGISNVIPIKNWDQTKIPKRSNKNPKNNAEYARNFIRSHGIAKSELRHSLEFKALPKKKQDAVRNQLRFNPEFGGTPRSKSKKKKSISKFKTPWVGLTTILPLLAAEGIILAASYKFYILMGLSNHLALISAFVVETAFMLTSAMNSVRATFLRLAILFLGLFSVCYSTYKSDPGLKQIKSFLESQKVIHQSKIDAQNVQIGELNLEKRQIQADMAIYRKHGLVSKGLSKLKIDKERNFKTLKLAQLRKEAAIQKLSALDQQLANQSDFSMNSIKAIQVKTWVMIALLTIIQFISVFFSKEFFKALAFIQSRRALKVNKGVHM